MIANNDKPTVLSTPVHRKASKTTQAKGQLAAYANPQKRKDEAEAFERVMMSKHADARRLRYHFISIWRRSTTKRYVAKNGRMRCSL